MYETWIIRCEFKKDKSYWTWCNVIDGLSPSDGWDVKCAVYVLYEFFLHADA